MILYDNITQDKARNRTAGEPHEHKRAGEVVVPAGQVSLSLSLSLYIYIHI